MTREERCEYGLLRLMTKETRKFAIGVNFPLPTEIQDALERLQLRDWIRLIDVSATAYSNGELLRVFRVMPEALAWFESAKSGGTPMSGGPHPSHQTRFAWGASSYDEICVLCGAHDEVPGGWGRLADPCPNADTLKDPPSATD